MSTRAPTTGRVFSFSVRVYYEDTDFSGVVYHARYLHFFERARTEALRESGIVHAELLERAEPLVFAVRRMTTEWIAPARIDDLLEARTAFRQARGARLLIDQALYREETLIARADVEAASMSLAGRPRRLPAEIVAALSVNPQNAP